MHASFTKPSFDVTEETVDPGRDGSIENLPTSVAGPLGLLDSVHESPYARIHLAVLEV